MYIPAAFRETRIDVLHKIIREYAFGTLVSQLNGELFATHIPFLLGAESGANGTLRGHMARENPHWQAFSSATQSLAIFQGPHAYISPSWYASSLAVPTWNYIAVHVYGVATVLDDAARVRDLLEATVNTFESGFAEPWSTTQLPDDYIGKLVKSIVAFELPIARLEGKRKLNQNRPAADREGAAAGLRRYGDSFAQAIADEMSQV